MFSSKVLSHNFAIWCWDLFSARVSQQFDVQALSTAMITMKPYLRNDKTLYISEEINASYIYIFTIHHVNSHIDNIVEFHMNLSNRFGKIAVQTSRTFMKCC